MNIQQIANHRELRPLKLEPRDVSHVVIEPNTTCNLRCARCYNQDRDVVKSLAQVKSEIDFARSRRTLETVSILGGEPTIHPDLPAIIRHVKSAGLVCQVLTNGVRLFEEGQGGLLDDLIAAGLDRIILHADCGQGRTPGETDRLIDTLFDRFEARGVLHSLSITLYPENSGTVPAVMRRHAHRRYFDGVLVTLAKDPAGTVQPGTNGQRDLDLAFEHERIVADLRIRAAAYIPSSLDDDFVSWVMYFYYMNAATGETFAMSPGINRLLRALYRLSTGRNLFGATLSPRRLPVSFLASALLEVAAAPRRLGEVIRLVRRSGRLGDLRFHYILMQDGPRYNARHGKVQICYMCPDATVRNGKITPVCLADQINPLHQSGRRADEELARTVYGHLREV
jgi:hypothetical protein